MHSGSRSKSFVLALIGGAVSLSLVSTPSRADEPIKATEPTLMAEPGEVVDVVDAFDTENKDPFDLWLSLGLVHSWESAKIRRESNIGPDGQPSDAGFTHNIENIANYKHTWTTLDMRMDVGIYHDLGFFLRVPLVLADDRSLDDLDGSISGVNALNGRASDSATGEPMFKLPFTSPTRSGIDYIAAGLRWAIFNQLRDPTKPTWTIELEGRFGVGEPMHPCNANPDPIDPRAYNAVNPGAPPPANPGTQPQCPSTQLNRVYDNNSGLWFRDPRDPGNSGGAGISRGTNAVKLGTMISERYSYVEPYGGFWFMAEFQKRGTEMGDFAGVNGVITNHPPLQGGIIGGFMVHPWENLENYQRFSIDFRFKATYVSQGRDYTPLFDALGTSNAQNLIAPNPASYHLAADGKTSVADFSKQIFFTGVTDVEAHGIFGGSTTLIMQAAKLIRFSVGFGFTYVQAYLASSADACNPDLQPSVGEAGRCRTNGVGGVTGTPNPNHRATIDLPGRRFRVTEDFIWDAWASGTIMF